MKHNYRDPKSGRFAKKNERLTQDMFPESPNKSVKHTHAHRDPISGRYAKLLKEYSGEDFGLDGIDITFEKDPSDFFKEHSLYDGDIKKTWRSMRRGETLRCEVMSNIIECYQRYPRVLNSNPPFKRYLISIFNIDLERAEILICPPSLSGQIKDEVLVQVKAIEHEIALKEKWMKHADMDLGTFSVKMAQPIIFDNVNKYWVRKSFTEAFDYLKVEVKTGFLVATWIIIPLVSLGIYVGIDKMNESQGNNYVYNHGSRYKSRRYKKYHFR